MMDWSILALAALVAMVHAEELCLTSNEDPYLLFGSKTAYEFASRKISIKKVHEVAGCQPIAFWLLSRHGSHNPETDEIADLQLLENLKNNIAQNYQNGNARDSDQTICNADLTQLKQWTWNPRHNATYAGNITSSGYMNSELVASSWKSRYPALLSNNRNDYLFKFEDNPTADTTFHAFTDGLFEVWGEGYGIPKDNDAKKIKPYKFCPTWTKDVEENNDTYTQVNIFKSKEEYKQMITNVSKRLGFNRYNLDSATVHRMYQMCRYNKAWNIAQLSAWCVAFSKEDLQLLEYAEDLETYYKYGYGTKINGDLGCSLIKDMMDFFYLHVNNELPQQPRVQIHLTDAPMIMFTLTALGARRDKVPLTGDNYHTKQMQTRRWATSVMAPFNANLAAVLYKCNTSVNVLNMEKYRVLLLENEQPMYFERCNVGLCDWTYVKETLGDVAARCDLGFCNGSDHFKGFLYLIFILPMFLLKLV